MKELDEVEFYLEDLKSKFTKIKPEEYYLSYSGGRDSHLLFWFLKTWLKENDLEMYENYLNVKIVGMNTFMEHKEINARINNNCDVVLRPKLKPFEIKTRFGSPCFSKHQDEMIRRYQGGCRTEYLKERITGIDKITSEKNNSRFNLNKTARELVLSGDLHKVSSKCCEYLKKKPAKKYEKESGRKPILGVRGGEGILRKSNYTSCFTKKGTFTPLWDLTEELEKKIYERYNIELPSVYQFLDRTGCIGCPYGSRLGNTIKELEVATPNQRKFIIKYFKESYDVLGVDYKRFLEEDVKDE